MTSAAAAAAERVLRSSINSYGAYTAVSVALSTEQRSRRLAGEPCSEQCVCANLNLQRRPSRKFATATSKLLQQLGVEVLV